MDRRSPGCYECEAEKFIRVVRRAASVGALSGFGCTGGRNRGSGCFTDEGVRCSDQVTSTSSGLECVTGTLRPGTDGTLSPADPDSVGPVGLFGTLSRLTLTLLAALSPSDSTPVLPRWPIWNAVPV